MQWKIQSINRMKRHWAPLISTPMFLAFGILALVISAGEEDRHGQHCRVSVSDLMGRCQAQLFPTWAQCQLGLVHTVLERRHTDPSFGRWLGSAVRLHCREQLGQRQQLGGQTLHSNQAVNVQIVGPPLLFSYCRLLQLRIISFELANLSLQQPQRVITFTAITRGQQEVGGQGIQTKDSAPHRLVKLLIVVRVRSLSRIVSLETYKKNKTSSFLTTCRSSFSILGSSGAA